MSNSDQPTKPPPPVAVYQPPPRPLGGLRKSVMGVVLPSVPPVRPSLGKPAKPAKVDLRSAPEHENTTPGVALAYNEPRRAPPPLPKTVQATGQPPISTLKGIGGPEPEPPRSHTPAPWERESMVDRVEAELDRHGDRLVRAPVSLPPPSASFEVKGQDFEAKIRASWLKRVIPWAAPIFLSAAGSVAGWVTGYARGLADAYERVTAIEERAKQLEQRTVTLSTRIDGAINAAAQEANSNRSERATANKKHELLVADVETLKASAPKIQGLKPNQ